MKMRLVSILVVVVVMMMSVERESGTGFVREERMGLMGVANRSDRSVEYGLRGFDVDRSYRSI